MDVKLLKVSLVFFALALSSCGQPAKLASATESLYSVSCTSSQAIMNEVIVEWEDGRVTLEKVKNIEKFKEDFVAPQINEIKLVQYNQRIRTMDVIPAGSGPTMETKTWGKDKVQAQGVWNQGIKGQNVLVGVVDSFVDDSHVQLKNRIAYNTAEIPGDGIDNDGNGIVDDYRGFDITGDKFNLTYEDPKNPGHYITDSYPNSHGSHVSGIIAGEHSSAGVYGIAPQSKIVIGSFLNHSGSGSINGAIQAMRYVASRGVKVINASWGMGDCAPALKNEIARLTDQGILFIAAAGNGNINTGAAYNLDFVNVSPASFNLPLQITVGASSVDDYATSFSNYSKTLVHLTAPGLNIYSTTPGNNWQYMTGTSMATPFVTGVAALLFSARPDAKPAQVKQAILESVDVISGAESLTLTQGRLNALKAVQKLDQIMTQ